MKQAGLGLGLKDPGRESGMNRIRPEPKENESLASFFPRLGVRLYAKKYGKNCFKTNFKPVL